MSAAERLRCIELACGRHQDDDAAVNLAMRLVALLEWPRENFVGPLHMIGKPDSTDFDKALKRMVETPPIKAPYRKRAENEPRRRFAAHTKLDPERVMALPPDHKAIAEKRTLFPTTVVEPAASPRLLVSGANQRKIGDRVAKGPWAGMPIFTLTLEERATCPEDCHNLAVCYGNGMPMARRHKHGPALEERLDRELADLQAMYPKGFVVRLHVLGDFYSVDYLKRWVGWLDRFPALRVFGYTAWDEKSEIGAGIAAVREAAWDRFAVRTSHREPGPSRAVTLWKAPENGKAAEGVVCPAQTGRTACCGSCGLCWAPAAKAKTIAFVAHGRLVDNQPTQAREPAPMSGAIVDQVYAAMQALSDLRGVPRRAIVQRTGLQAPQVTEALKRLHKQGHVYSTGERAGTRWFLMAKPAAPEAAAEEDESPAGEAGRADPFAPAPSATA